MAKFSMPMIARSAAPGFVGAALMVAPLALNAAVISDDFDAGFATWNATVTPSESSITFTSAAQSPFDNDVNSGIRLVRGVQPSNPQAVPNTLGLSNNFANQTTTTYVQFDVRFGAGAKNPAFQLTSSGTQAVLMHLRGSTGGTVQNRTSSAFESVGGITPANDTWYRYTYTLDYAADTYDFRIQSLESTDLDVSVNDIVFRNAVSGVNGAKFIFNIGDTDTQGGSYDMDNFLLTTNAGELNFAVIPEPQSALFGALGVLLFLRRRR